MHLFLTLQSDMPRGSCAWPGSYLDQEDVQSMCNDRPRSQSLMRPNELRDLREAQEVVLARYRNKKRRLEGVVGFLNQHLKRTPQGTPINRPRSLEIMQRERTEARLLEKYLATIEQKIQRYQRRVVERREAFPRIIERRKREGGCQIM